MGSGDSENGSSDGPPILAGRRTDAFADAGVAAVIRMLTALGVLILMTPAYGQAPSSQAPARSATPSSAPPSPTRTPVRDVAAASPPAVGGARIRGRVVRADGTTPIRRAQVVLAGDQNVKRM